MYEPIKINCDIFYDEQTGFFTISTLDSDNQPHGFCWKSTDIEKESFVEHLLLLMKSINRNSDK